MAEPPKPSAAPAKPVVTMPQSTTETYGDWVLICSTAPNGQICEVDSSLSLRGQAEAVARIAFGQPAKGKPLRLVVQTPNNVLIAPGVKLDIEPDKKSIALLYRSCAPGGCFAEADLSPDQNQFVHGRSDPGQLIFTDASGPPGVSGVFLKATGDGGSDGALGIGATDGGGGGGGNGGSGGFQVVW